MCVHHVWSGDLLPRQHPNSRRVSPLPTERQRCVALSSYEAGSRRWIGVRLATTPMDSASEWLRTRARDMRQAVVGKASMLGSNSYQAVESGEVRALVPQQPYCAPVREPLALTSPPHLLRSSTRPRTSRAAAAPDAAAAAAPSRSMRATMMS